MAGIRGSGKPPGDPLVAVDATIQRLDQIEQCARNLRLTAPQAVAELGDLSRRMKPTAIGFVVDLTTEEWASIAIEHQFPFTGEGYP